MDVKPFVIGGESIPSLQENPVKTLGRVFDGALTDRKSTNELDQKLCDGLALIDKSVITGVMKLFTYQTILLQRICWPVMVYEIGITWVKRCDQHINRYLRKWLGVSKSLSTVALFSKDSPLPLPKAPRLSVNFSLVADRWLGMRRRVAGRLFFLGPIGGSTLFADRRFSRAGVASEECRGCCHRRSRASPTTAGRGQN